MISCERINWICHFVGCISHHMLRLIAVNMKYLLPATRSFSNLRGNSGNARKKTFFISGGVPLDFVGSAWILTNLYQSNPNMVAVEGDTGLKSWSSRTWESSASCSHLVGGLPHRRWFGHKFSQPLRLTTGLFPN